MDARETLRRLIQQRLEAGETTIVLESMLASEVVAPRSTGEGSKPARAPRATSSDRSVAAVEQPSRADDVSQRRSADLTGSPADWRAALQQSGAEPLAQKSHKSKAPVVSTSSASTTARPARPSAVKVTPDAPLPPMHSLGEVEKVVASCTRCPLYATALNPVPGEGNHNADFMIVGEAPGATEDETGKPFVGRAGQLLTQILAAIQLNREDVFICNVLKHRPPGNRNPEPDEVRA